MMPPNAMQPEAQDAPAEGADTGDGSYEICLSVMPNEQFSVYKESGGQGQDAQGMESASSTQAGAEPDAPRDTVNGIEAALKEVLALYRANPIGGDEESGMKAGYAETSRRMGR